jgi:hypothetical protein
MDNKTRILLIRIFSELGNLRSEIKDLLEETKSEPEDEQSNLPE